MSAEALRGIWKSGRAALGTYVMFSTDIAAVEIAAASGLDFLVFDLEHRPQGVETVHDMCQAARLAGITPLVGPADISEHAISHVLDLGALGVIIPHVRTPEEVRLSIDASRYPPVGRRGRAGVAGHNVFRPPASVAEEVARQTEEILLLLKVESEPAIARIDELLAPAGVDGVMIGPTDLSLDMGIPGETRNPRLLKLIDKVREACLKRGLRYGDYVSSPEDVRKAIDAGASWVIFSSEMDLMATGWRRAVQAVRG